MKIPYDFLKKYLVLPKSTFPETILVNVHRNLSLSKQTSPRTVYI
jgi:hypothetical protein